MKKKTIIIVLIILIPIIVLYIDDKKNRKEVMNTWDAVEQDFNRLNDILIKSVEDNGNMYNIFDVRDNEIVSIVDSSVKVEMNEEEKELFNKLLEYYKNELSYKENPLFSISVFSNGIVYSTDDAHFCLIYVRRGKVKRAWNGLELYHLKGDWYFQSARHVRKFK